LPESQKAGIIAEFAHSFPAAGRLPLTAKEIISGALLLETHPNLGESNFAMALSVCPVQDLSDEQILGQLTRIWEHILCVDSLTPDQNYFDLGGDSSLAVKMFAQIEEVFKVKLPIATLYQAPTVCELAEILRGAISTGRWLSLVQIQPNGTRFPFFCIHPHGGNVLVYRELSRHLGADQPFFGLQSRGLDGSEEPLTRIENMAELYAAEIRQAQPRGPYFIGGYCMGGAVAYEIARQLHAQGEQVALVALFDAMEFSQFHDPSFLQMSYYNCQRIFFHLANIMRLNSDNRSRFVSEKLRGLRVRLPVWLARVLGNTAQVGTASQATVLGRIWKANFEAYLNYVAKPYAGTVVDIRPCRQYRMFDHEQFKWGRLARGGQKTVVLPVNPPAMLSDAFVAHLAQALRQCLDEAMDVSSVSADHTVPARLA
jgi:phthiocerol/phenolphthiocerol synthesis type-I polyketide synthase E